MGKASEDQLRRGLAELRIDSAASTAAKLLEFGSLLLEANQSTNLTGAKNLAAIVGEHILDRLAPLKLISIKDPVIDVGSGAGFPGIPAAVVYPKKRFILVEPRAKRAEFLASVIPRLGLKNVTVVKSSAQGPGAANLVGAGGSVLMRAVAPPARALQIGLRLLRLRGALMLFEGRAAMPNAEDRAIARRYGGLIQVRRISVPGLTVTRHVWVVEKLR